MARRKGFVARPRYRERSHVDIRRGISTECVNASWWTAATRVRRAFHGFSPFENSIAAIEWSEQGEEEGREKNSFPIDFYCLVIVRRPRVPLLLLVSLNSYAIFGNILIGSEIIIYFIALRRSYCWKCFVSFVERELCSRSVGDDLQLIDELFPLFWRIKEVLKRRQYRWWRGATSSDGRISGILLQREYFKGM